MGKFKGQTIQLAAPERLLPTTSTGIDLREARQQNSRPPMRDGGRFEDRTFSRGERPEGRSFEDGPRRGFRGDEDEGPRRTFSKRSNEEGGAGGSRAEEETDWRSGMATLAPAVRSTESYQPRRFDSTEDRRSSTRSETTPQQSAPDMEEDWRMGSVKTASVGFQERRQPLPRREESSEETSGGFRRIASREATKADEEDNWRNNLAAPVARDTPRLDRTRSTKPMVQTRADDDDWRTGTPKVSSSTSNSHSATPWARKGAESAGGSDRKERPEKVDSQDRSDRIDKSVVADRLKKVITKVEEPLEKWSSSSESEADEPAAIAPPDMEKISKFVERVEKLLETSDAKKIESMVKKIPVNFGVPELRSIETTKAVVKAMLNRVGLVLDNNTSSAEETQSSIEQLATLVAPVTLCLEELFAENGGNVINQLSLVVIEEAQVFANSRGMPRLSPETALVEALWIALYESKIVPEEAFQVWLDSDSFTSPNKSTTVFQTEAFRAWLYNLELHGVEATKKQVAPVAQQKDEWSDSDEDSDIEALIPKRIDAASLHLRPTTVTPIRR